MLSQEERTTLNNMEEKVSHRSTEDEQWQETRRQCWIRDRGICRCCAILTPEEVGIRSTRYIPSNFLTASDVAHIEAVGAHVEKTYDLDNVVLLCRSCHQSLDSFVSPVTGKSINSEEHTAWWNRIKNGSTSYSIQNENTTSGLESYLDRDIPKKHFDPEAWLDS